MRKIKSLILEITEDDVYLNAVILNQITNRKFIWRWFH